MPGRARWKAMFLLAHQLLSKATAEMQDYHDDRTEQWQESSKAKEMLEEIGRLDEIANELQSLE